MHGSKGPILKLEVSWYCRLQYCKHGVKCVCGTAEGHHHHRVADTLGGGGERAKVGELGKLGEGAGRVELAVAREGAPSRGGVSLRAAITAAS